MHAKHNHASAWIALHDLLGCFNSVEVRHGNIHDHHVRVKFFRQPHRLAAVRGFADNLKILSLLQLEPRLFSRRHDRRQSECGSYSCLYPTMKWKFRLKIAVPFWACEVMAKVPPSCLTRSRIPTSPGPHGEDDRDEADAVILNCQIDDI